MHLETVKFTCCFKDKTASSLMTMLMKSLDKTLKILLLSLVAKNVETDYEF